MSAEKQLLAEIAAGYLIKELGHEGTAKALGMRQWTQRHDPECPGGESCFGCGGGTRSFYFPEDRLP